MRWHSAAFQTTFESIYKRQKFDCERLESLGVKDDNFNKRENCLGMAQVTILEVILHTERIQKQIQLLAAICLFSYERSLDKHDNTMDSSVLKSSELLSFLYTDLLEADNNIGPMIRYNTLNY